MLHLKAGVLLEGENGTKAAFQILGKCCISIASFSNEKRKFKMSSELTIPWIKSHEHCVTWCVCCT